MTEPQKPGEYWVCTYAEDVDHFGAVDKVPVDNRFIAYHQIIPSHRDETRPVWWRCDHDKPLEAHWLVPIRKVDLA
jgi:hypothetical protein